MDWHAASCDLLPSSSGGRLPTPCCLTSLLSGVVEFRVVCRGVGLLGRIRGQSVDVKVRKYKVHKKKHKIFGLYGVVRGLKMGQ